MTVVPIAWIIFMLPLFRLYVKVFFFNYVIVIMDMVKFFIIGSSIKVSSVKSRGKAVWEDLRYLT